MHFWSWFANALSLVCLISCGPLNLESLIPPEPSPEPPVTTTSGPGPVTPAGDDGRGGFEVFAIAAHNPPYAGLAPTNLWDIYAFRAVRTETSKTFTAQRIRPPNRPPFTQSLYPQMSANQRYLTYQLMEFVDNEMRSRAWVYDLESNTHTSLTNDANHPHSVMEGIVDSNFQNAIFSTSDSNLSPSALLGYNILNRNLATSVTSFISRSYTGDPIHNSERPDKIFVSNPRASLDGNDVFYASNASNILSPEVSTWQLYVFNRTTNQTTRLTQRPGGLIPKSHAYQFEITPNGRYVAFTTLPNFWQDYDFPSANSTSAICPGGSSSINFLCSGTQVFLLDRTLNSIERVSVDSLENPAVCGGSRQVSVDDSSKALAFASTSKTLSGQEGDCLSGGGPQRIYLRDRIRSETLLASADAGRKLRGPCHSPKISPDGKEIMFFCETDRFEDEGIESHPAHNKHLFIYRVVSQRLMKLY